MKRYVAIGSSMNHDYSFFMPFTALLWRDRIGYEPVILLSGSEQDWEQSPQGAIVSKLLRRLDLFTVYIPFIEGVSEGTIAQTARHHAAVLDLPQDSILIPSDADLWPLKKDFYYQHDAEKYPIGLYYSNGYGSDTHFPTCHQSMRIGTWREVMGLDSSDIQKEIRLSFSEGKLLEREGLDVWFFDEHYSSQKIRSSKYFPDKIQFIEREGQPPQDRIDRGPGNKWWPKNLTPAQILGKTDAHLPRPGYTDEIWPQVEPIVKAVMDQPDLYAYRDEFKAAMNA